jgi:putative intracellular protease/amidase
MSSHTHNQVLVVLTNTREFPRRNEEYESMTGSNRTGFDIKEVAHLYECLSKHNIQLIFATPRGGEAHIDPCSLEASKNDDTVSKFLKDSEAMRKIKSTKKLEECRRSQFMGAIFPGGAGVLFDLPNEHIISEIVEEIYPRKQSFIAAIGHGLAALVNVKDKEGEYWLEGKRVTCQTVEEEKDMKLERQLPFMLEEKLKQIGAKVEKASKFSPKVVEDDRLITAQNNRSVKEWIETISRYTRLN